MKNIQLESIKGSNGSPDNGNHDNGSPDDPETPSPTKSEKKPWKECCKILLAGVVLAAVVGLIYLIIWLTGNKNDGKPPAPKHDPMNATFIMVCELPHYVIEMCWWSDDKLLVNSGPNYNRYMYAMDVNLDNKSCSVTRHPYGQFKVTDMSCYDRGEAFVVPECSPFVYIYTGLDKPERWAPDELSGNISTITVNKEYIVINNHAEHRDDRFVYFYNRDRMFLYKSQIYTGVTVTYDDGFLSRDNYLWINRGISTGVFSVYYLNDKSLTSIDGRYTNYRTNSMSGFGEYVAVVNRLNNTIMVHLQDGRFSHIVDMVMPKENPIYIRDRGVEPPLLASPISDINIYSLH